MRLLVGSLLGLSLVLLTTSQPDTFVGHSIGSGGGGAGSCPKDSEKIFDGTKTFLNCLGDKILHEFNHVKTSEGKSKINRYVSDEKKRVKNILKDAGCKINIDKPLSNFLRDSMGSSRIVYKDIVENLNIIIWETAKEPYLAECFLDFLRTKFLKYMSRCTEMNIPTSKGHGLKDVPTLSINYDLKSAKKVLEYHLKAHLAAFKCGKTEKTRAISVVAHQAVCDCSHESYEKPCLRYMRKQGCSTTQECIRDIFNSREDIVSGAEVLGQADHCWKEYNKYRVRAGRSKNVKLVDLVDPGKKLAAAFGKLTLKDKVEGARIIQAFLDAQFSVGFCSKCYLQ